MLPAMSGMKIHKKYNPDISLTTICLKKCRSAVMINCDAKLYMVYANG